MILKNYWADFKINIGMLLYINKQFSTRLDLLFSLPSIMDKRDLLTERVEYGASTSYCVIGVIELNILEEHYGELASKVLILLSPNITAPQKNSNITKPHSKGI